MEIQEACFREPIVKYTLVPKLASNHILDTLELLKLQRGAETSCLNEGQSPEAAHQHHPVSHLEIIQLWGVEYAILVDVAYPKYAAQCIYTSRLENLGKSQLQ